ncbi:unnamed protein product [Brassica oleracea]|uniref:(rape) hypothetical protein n=1 Tax=Brassica napus TaxID=3708 RepID=A0A816JHC8_BRANA|nr:unnamed protein product [Brassica napus]
MRACIIYIEGLKKFAPLTSSRVVPNNHTWVQLVQVQFRLESIAPKSEAEDFSAKETTRPCKTKKKKDYKTMQGFIFIKILRLLMHVDTSWLICMMSLQQGATQFHSN